jgi:hypothetical protein
MFNITLGWGSAEPERLRNTAICNNIFQIVKMPYSLACSLFSPHEKQCPNCESANSCNPPDAATLK